MKLRQLKSNMTVLTLNDGTEVLFSYETPVAGYLPMVHDLDSQPFHEVDGNGVKVCLDTVVMFFRTDKQFSKTTTRHINQYLDGAKATTVAQAQIENLIN